MSIVYRLCEIKVKKNQYRAKEEMQTMLDIFLIGERIVNEEYEALVSLLNINEEK